MMEIAVRYFLRKSLAELMAYNHINTHDLPVFRRYGLLILGYPRRTGELGLAKYESNTPLTPDDQQYAHH